MTAGLFHKASGSHGSHASHASCGGLTSHSFNTKEYVSPESLSPWRCTRSAGRKFANMLCIYRLGAVALLVATHTKFVSGHEDCMSEFWVVRVLFSVLLAEQRRLTGMVSMSY